MNTRAPHSTNHLHKETGDVWKQRAAQQSCVAARGILDLGQLPLLCPSNAQDGPAFPPHMYVSSTYVRRTGPAVGRIRGALAPLPGSLPNL